MFSFTWQFLSWYGSEDNTYIESKVYMGLSLDEAIQRFDDFLGVHAEQGQQDRVLYVSVVNDTTDETVREHGHHHRECMECSGMRKWVGDGPVHVGECIS